MKTAAQEFSRWKEPCRYGEPFASTGTPAAPVLLTAVPPVAPAVEQRFRALQNRSRPMLPTTPPSTKRSRSKDRRRAVPTWRQSSPRSRPRTKGGTVLVGWDWGGHRAYLDLCGLQVDAATGAASLCQPTTAPRATPTQSPSLRLRRSGPTAWTTTASGNGATR